MNRFFFKTYVLLGILSLFIVSFAGVFIYLKTNSKKLKMSQEFIRTTKIVNCAMFNENYASRFFLTNSPLSHKPYNTGLFEISYGLDGWK